MKSRLIAAALLCVPAAGLAQGTTADQRELLRLHAELIRAHVEDRVDLWMSIEADELLSINGGTVDVLSPEERRAARADYLSRATFTRYEDIREPVVRISEDGSLGWLAAEVRVTGTLAGDAGSVEPFDDVWAWVELYVNTPDGWKLAGNASSRRDP